MTQINLIRYHDGLRPSLPEDADKLAKIKAGTIIASTIKAPRNAGFHRKFFALLGIVVDHTDFENVDQVLHILKIRLGHYDPIIEPITGKTFLHPRSIAFAKMDQSAFDDFYNQSVNVILEFMLAGWSKETLDQAYEQVLQF